MIYRLKKYFPASIKPRTIALRRLGFDAFGLIASKGKYLAPGSFRFLNQTKQFGDAIDWNFNGHGKLWNYNLQYFDYVLDPAMPSADAEELIEDFAEKILSRQILLEPYPVSLRLVNWLLYHSRTGYTSDVFLKAISVQIQFLSGNPEYHIEANHLLENYIALFVCALYTGEELPRNIGDKLLQELDRQLLDDGAHYECSPMYHIIVLAKLYVLYLLLSENGLDNERAGRLKPLIRKMTGWLSAFQYADGSYGLFNDAAPCIAIEPAVLFKFAAQLGIDHTPCRLRSSGYRKRHLPFGEVLIDAGNVLPSFQPGHAHSDMLSFTLFAKGREWLIDPGVSTYEKNGQRAKERSTFYHNTVTINDANQSDVWDGFRVGRRARVSIEQDDAAMFVASHNGYLKTYGCLHRRSFVFDNGLQVIDRIISRKEKKIRAAARFYINGSIMKVSSSSYVVNDQMHISFSDGAEVESAEVQLPDGFNQYRAAGVLSVTFAQELFTKIEFS